MLYIGFEPNPNQSDFIEMEDCKSTARSIPQAGSLLVVVAGFGPPHVDLKRLILRKNLIKSEQRLLLRWKCGFSTTAQNRVNAKLWKSG
jgi:hypothetical protein